MSPLIGKTVKARWSSRLGEVIGTIQAVAYSTVDDERNFRLLVLTPEGTLVDESHTLVEVVSE